MGFILYFAGRNACRYSWLFIAMVVIFADTGMVGGRARRPSKAHEICQAARARLGLQDRPDLMAQQDILSMLSWRLARPPSVLF